MEYFFLNCGIPLKEMMDGLERNLILSALNKVNGNQKKAAKVLGVKYTTLNEKIKKCNIHLRKTAS